MNKLVYTVFSTLAFAIIFVFVWDMVFYLYRVNSLNTRIENITSAMQNTQLPPFVRILWMLNLPNL